MAITYKEMKTIKFPNSDVVYVVNDDSKVEKDHGVENAGKVLSVGENGLITLIDAKNLETEIPDGILTYIAQTLTTDQKTQARANIGAGTSNFNGNYNSLTNKPTLFSGSYNDLTDKPTLFSGSYDDLTNKPTVSSVDVDSVLSANSTNPVQNKVIYAALEKKSDSTHTHEDMATITYVDDAIATAIEAAIGGSY